MSEKLVLCCRLPGAGMPARGRGYLERARSLIARAEARGGTLVAWGNARLYFAFEPNTIDDVIALVTKPGDEGRPGEERFAFGVAQGPIEALETDGTRADLGWGHALVAAGALSMAGRAGQVLLADRVKAVRTGELVLNGGRFAAEAGMRLRGLALDVRQPWKRDAVASVARLVEPALVGADESTAEFAVKPGSYGVLCAPRGHGGSRRLASLGRRHGDRALMVHPVGAGLEPLGALRRAVARAIHDDIPPALAPHASALESLLSSEPLSVDVAEDLVCALLGARAPGGAPGVVLIDDAELVDAESLEVLAAAMRGSAPLPVILRVAAEGTVPVAFTAKGAPAAKLTVAPLATAAAEALAAAFTGDALEPDAKKRWARLGDGTPLGILEALAHGLQSTELAWIGDRAAPRRKSSGRGKPRPAAHFITLRAHECAPAARTLLAAVALLGGEARVELLTKILDAAQLAVGVDAQVKELGRSRWLLSPEPGWVALPSRTHVDALVKLLEPPVVHAIHRAAIEVIELSETGFARLDAARHAVAVGDLERAQRIVTASLLALGQARHTAAVTRLRALADLGPSSVVVESTDEHTSVEVHEEAPAAGVPPEAAPPPPPESEPTFVLLKAGPTSALMPAAVELVPASEINESKVPTQENPNALPLPAATAQARPPSNAPDSEPPTIADAAPILTNLAQLQRTLTPRPPPKVAAPAPREATLQEQVKDAIMASNHEGLERLLSGHTGDSFVDRVRALSRLKRGEIGEALRVLRRVRHGPDASPSARSQTALSLGIAYAASSRFEESLLEGLTALARAREAGDPRGVHACLSFLARLYTVMSRTEEAAQLREAATGITFTT